MNGISQKQAIELLALNVAFVDQGEQPSIIDASLWSDLTQEGTDQGARSYAAALARGGFWREAHDVLAKFDPADRGARAPFELERTLLRSLDKRSDLLLGLISDRDAFIEDIQKLDQTFRFLLADYVCAFLGGEHNGLTGGSENTVFEDLFEAQPFLVSVYKARLARFRGIKDLAFEHLAEALGSTGRGTGDATGQLCLEMVACSDWFDTPLPANHFSFIAKRKLSAFSAPIKGFILKWLASRDSGLALKTLKEFGKNNPHWRELHDSLPMAFEDPPSLVNLVQERKAEKKPHIMLGALAALAYIASGRSRDATMLLEKMRGDGTANLTRTVLIGSIEAQLELGDRAIADARQALISDPENRGLAAAAFASLCVQTGTRYPRYIWDLIACQSMPVADYGDIIRQYVAALAGKTDVPPYPFLSEVKTKVQSEPAVASEVLAAGNPEPPSNEMNGGGKDQSASAAALTSLTQAAECSPDFVKSFLKATFGNHLSAVDSTIVVGFVNRASVPRIVTLIIEDELHADYVKWLQGKSLLCHPLADMAALDAFVAMMSSGQRVEILSNLAGLPVEIVHKILSERANAPSAESLPHLKTILARANALDPTSPALYFLIQLLMQNVPNGSFIGFLNCGIRALELGKTSRAQHYFSSFPGEKVHYGIQGMTAAVRWPSRNSVDWPYRPLGLREAFEQMKPADVEWPSITVVTPSYNQAEFVEETLLSVLHQEYPSLQYIVIDAESDDGSKAILESYRDRVDELIIEPDGGQSDAINKGLSKATGTLCTWLNSDDMFAPGALFQFALEYIRTGADVISGICFEHQDRIVSRAFAPLARESEFAAEEIADLPKKWLEGFYFRQPETVFTKDIWLRSGGRLETDLYHAMDFDLWLRFAEAGGTYTNIKWPTAYFRIHDKQKTADRVASTRELCQIRDRHEMGSPTSETVRIIRRVSGILNQDYIKITFAHAERDLQLFQPMELLIGGKVVITRAKHLDEIKTLDHSEIVIVFIDPKLEWTYRIWLLNSKLNGIVAAWIPDASADARAAMRTAACFNIVVPGTPAISGLLKSRHSVVTRPILPFLAPDDSKIAARASNPDKARFFSFLDAARGEGRWPRARFQDSSSIATIMELTDYDSGYRILQAVLAGTVPIVIDEHNVSDILSRYGLQKGRDYLTMFSREELAYGSLAKWGCRLKQHSEADRADHFHVLLAHNGFVKRLQEFFDRLAELKTA